MSSAIGDVMKYRSLLDDNLDLHENGVSVLALSIGSDELFGTGVKSSASAQPISTVLTNEAPPVSATPLGEISDALFRLEVGIEDTQSKVAKVHEGAELVQEALKTFERIEFAADKVADTMEGFVRLLKVVQKVPPLKFAAKKLSKVFADLGKRMRDLEKKAKKADEDLKESKEAVDKAIDRLMDFEDLLEAAGLTVADMRASVDTADDIYTQIAGYDGYDGDLDATLDEAFGLALGNADGIFALLDVVNLETGEFDDVLSALTPQLNGLARISEQISSIAGELDFLREPLDLLSDAIRPIEGLLDAVGIVYDTLVAPIVDPILGAFGVDALFNEIGASLRSLFPQSTALDAALAAITDLASGLGVDTGFAVDIGGVLDAFLDGLRADFLDPILEIIPDTDEVIIQDPDAPGNIEGGSGNDLITGTPGDDVINGFGGTDILTPGRGDDIVDGGAGRDAVAFDGIFLSFLYTRISSTQVDFTSAAQGTDSIRNVEIYSFRDISLTNAQLDSVIRLDSGDFTGGAEADIVFATGNFVNVLDGGAGNDFLSSGAGNDQLFGGEGDDVLAPGAGVVLADGGAGFDTVSYLDQGSGVIAILLSEAERAANPDLGLPANTDADVYVSIEQLIGSENADTLFGALSGDVIEGRAGDDLIRGLSGDDEILGGDGNDALFGDLGNDIVAGEAGDDVLFSGLGNDQLQGGAGFDTAYYGGTVLPTAVRDALTALAFGMSDALDKLAHRIVYDGEANTVLKFDENGNLIGVDTLSDIERIYAPDGNNLLLGTRDGRQTLVGGAGDDIIRGNGSRDGIDAFFGGGGDDTIFLSGIGRELGNGGTGTNVYIWDHVGDFEQDYNLRIDSRGTDTIDLSTSEYGLVSFIGTPVGETQEDVIHAFSGVQGFDTGISFTDAGIGTFIATQFADDLDFRGERVAIIIAGAGNDRILGQASGEFDVRMQGGDGNDLLVLTESITGIGLGTRSTLFGGAGNDQILDLSDNDADRFEGGDGDDIFFVDAQEADRLLGGDGNDSLSLNQVRPGDSYLTTINLNRTRFDSIENALGGYRDDTIIGTSEDNVLAGSDGDDTIRGGDGNDTLFGDRGVDQLFGEAGDDTLYVGPGGSSGATELLDGGTGNDTVSLQYAIAPIPDPQYRLFAYDTMDHDWSAVADLDAGTATLTTMHPANPRFPEPATYNPDIYEFQLVNVENLRGTSADDTLRGDRAVNVISGGEGDDLLMGRGGDDALLGGDGDDIIMGGRGNDVLSGGFGADQLYGGAGDDMLDASVATSGLLIDMSRGRMIGTDIRTEWAWADTGTQEWRTISFSTIEGGGVLTDLPLNPDTINGATPENADSFYDLFVMWYRFYEEAEGLNLQQWYAGLQTLDEAFAADPANWDIVPLDFSTLSVSTFSGIEDVTGSLFDDMITGNGGDNLLVGLGGADTLIGGLGSDILRGGDGSDVIDGDGGSALDSIGRISLNVGGGDRYTDGSYDGAVLEHLVSDTYAGLRRGDTTIEMLYQASERTPSQSTYLLSYATADNVDEIQIAMFGTGRLQIVWGGESYNTDVFGLDDGALHRLSVVYDVYQEDGQDLAELRVYMDGVLVFTEAGRPAQTIDPEGRLIFGARNNDVSGRDAGLRADRLLNGELGDIRIFDTARTDAEIAASAFSQLDPAESGLVDNWVMDGSSVTNSAGTAELIANGGVIIVPSGTDIDVAVFDGPRDRYHVEQADDGPILVTDLVGDGGTDRLVNIERIAFDGQSEVSFDPTELVADDLTLIQGTEGTRDLRGTGGDDAIIGTAEDEEIAALTGQDSIVAGGGDDIIVADLAFALGDVEGQIFRAYRAVFDRQPDMGGFDLFVAAVLLGDLTQEDVIAEFVESDEFSNTYGRLSNGAFVDLLYRNVFDREADPGGREAFLNALDGGATRAEVVISFANSAEFIQMTALESAAFATNMIVDPIDAQLFRLYQAVFDRAPDDAGFAAFTGSLSTGLLFLSDIVDEFITSAEFQATYGDFSNRDFVEALYANVLPGNTDETGRAAFTAALDNGDLTRADVVETFSESFEFRQATADGAAAYVQVFNRFRSDSIRGGSGDDILFGGEGADNFVFDVDTDGNETILDFVAGEAGDDVIQLLTFAEFDTFAEVRAAATQVGTDVFIDFENGQSLTLVNVALEDLNAQDFLFEI